MTANLATSSLRVRLVLATQTPSEQPGVASRLLWKGYCCVGNQGRAIEPEQGRRGGRPDLRGRGDVAHKGLDGLFALVELVFTGAVQGLAGRGK